MKRSALMGIVLIVLLGACSGGETATEHVDSITLVTHASFDISEEVLARFEQDTGIAVEILRSDDAGTMLNQAILTKDNPVGDVLYGIDNTFLSRGVDEGLFEPYTSSLIDTVPEELRLDPAVTPIDFGDVCVNYDRDVFSDAEAPQSLMDLTAPQFRGLAVENPATSSPGLAFLLSTIAEFGEEGDYTWQDYWTDLKANDVVVTPGWEEAYYGQFSGGSGEGTLPLVVSYASSPPVEVLFSDPQPDVAPTGVMQAGCFRQIEFAGILAGTDAPQAAGRFIDFMLSVDFQEDIPLHMFVFPANSNAALPDLFVKHTTIPSHPATLDSAAIDANRERWIEEWDTLMTP